MNEVELKYTVRREDGQIGWSVDRSGHGDDMVEHHVEEIQRLVADTVFERTGVIVPSATQKEDWFHEMPELADSRSGVAVVPAIKISSGRHIADPIGGLWELMIVGCAFAAAIAYDLWLRSRATLRKLKTTREVH